MSNKKYENPQISTPHRQTNDRIGSIKRRTGNGHESNLNAEHNREHSPDDDDNDPSVHNSDDNGALEGRKHMARKLTLVQWSTSGTLLSGAVSQRQETGKRKLSATCKVDMLLTT